MDPIEQTSGPDAKAKDAAGRTGQDRRAAMGRAGSRRVREHFGLDRMVDETLAVYQEIARGGRP